MTAVDGPPESSNGGIYASEGPLSGWMESAQCLIELALTVTCVGDASVPDHTQGNPLFYFYWSFAACIFLRTLLYVEHTFEPPPLSIFDLGALTTCGLNSGSSTHTVIHSMLCSGIFGRVQVCCKDS